MTAPEGVVDRVRRWLAWQWQCRPPLLAMTAGGFVGWALAMAASRALGWWT